MMRRPHSRGLRVALLTSLALAVPVALVEGGTVHGSALRPLRAGTARSPTRRPSSPRASSSTASPSRQGVTPSPFTGEVLGVLKDGVLPGIDMVMARLDSTDDPGGRRHLAGHVGLAGVRRGRSPDRCRGLRPLVRALTGRRHHAVRADADVAQPDPAEEGDGRRPLGATARPHDRRHPGAGAAGLQRAAHAARGRRGARPRSSTASPPGPTCPSPRRWPAPRRRR